MKEKSYCIYIHINKINNKVYIGQTCQEPEKRWGTQYSNWGKHLSAETKSKIGKGGVICIETGKYYCSSNEGAKDVGLKSGTHIRDVCRGERKTAGKYHWKYAEVN